MIKFIRALMVVCFFSLAVLGCSSQSSDGFGTSVTVNESTTIQEKRVLCWPARIIEKTYKGLGYKIDAIGTDINGYTITVFVDEIGNWRMILHKTDGRACILIFGTDWSSAQIKKSF